MFYRKHNYLLILSIIVSVITFFSLIWKKVDPDNGFTYFMSPWKLYELNANAEEINEIFFPFMGIGMLGFFNTALKGYTLMWFNNLLMQKKIIMMLILVDITQLVFSFVFSNEFNRIWLPYVDGKLGWGIICIAVNILIHLLAFIFVYRDIRLLQASKRFR